VLDLKVPDNTPGWLTRLGIAIIRPFASIDEWVMHRPWETIHAAMQEELADVSWTELFLGSAFLASGSRGLEHEA
jgi:demethylmenaquinone methyltransferase/2-methoxy-6-polyprenyl-1,4-benzoquinol methylase